MLPASSRLLRLLGLLQQRRSWSGPQLAERLGVTTRTVRRDVERLRGLGYRVRALPGAEGGYHLEAGTQLPPLAFEEDEALALALALRSAALGGVRGLEESALVASMKLETLLPARLARRLKSLFDAVQPLTNAAPAADLGHLAALADASELQQVVELRYRDVQGRSSVRRMEPAGLVCAESRWYLVAWDRGRADWRTLRVDRIEDVRTMGDAFSPRPLPAEDGVTGGSRGKASARPPTRADLAAFVARRISTDVYRVQARVVLHSPVDAAQEQISPLAGRLEPLGPARCRLVTGAHRVAALAAWLLSLDMDFEVESPPELQDCLRRMQARLERTLAPS